MIIHPLDLQAIPASKFENPLSAIRGSALSRPGGIRIFISDLLYPFEPVQLESTLGTCDRLLIIQVLSAFEANPGEGLEGGGMMRLTNAEADEYLDVRLDERTVTHYQKRLAALQSDLSQRLQLRGGAFATTHDNDSLDALARNLHRSGIITV